MNPITLRRSLLPDVNSVSPRRSLPADARAADHLLVHIPIVASSALAREARSVAQNTPTNSHIYALDEREQLAGVLPIAALLTLLDDEPIAPHLHPPPEQVRLDEDQEHVALLAIRDELDAVPVADSDGRFAGIIPASVLLRVLHHEHVEDMDRLVGVLRQSEHAAEALEEPASRRARKRLPWLLVGLAGSALATAVMASFEESLQRRVAVAFFIPGIVYIADAIGTQTEAIAVRALSFRHKDVTQLFAGELRTGLLLGSALALPVFPAVAWVFHDARLGAAVAIAVLVAGTVATAVGLGIPFALQKFGKDPALGSGPLATVCQDILSLVAYFGAVKLLLG